MPPRIFYHCYDHNRPTGGQKDTYQHVDVLNRSGFEAYAVHSKPGFRLRWFDNATLVMDGPTFMATYDPSRDFMVLPEDLGAAVLQVPGRKVIFNKNLYSGAQALDDAATDPYRSDDVVAIFSVSEHTARHLRYAYPDRPVTVVPYDLRSEAFAYKPLRDKRRRIACLPKAMPMVSALRQILNARARAGHALAEFEWVVLRDLDERRMSRVLEDALVLVFLSVEEGLPRVPLEGMAAGCLLAVFACGPLAEYLPARVGFAYGDLVAMARFIEDVCARHPHGLGEFDSITAHGRAVAESFSAARQTAAVVAAWTEIFERTC